MTAKANHGGLVLEPLTENWVIWAGSKRARLTNDLLSLAVLIMPTDPKMFFPNRGNSISNMAEFKLA